MDRQRAHKIKHYFINASRPRASQRQVVSGRAKTTPVTERKKATDTREMSTDGDAIPKTQERKASKHRPTTAAKAPASKTSALKAPAPKAPAKRPAAGTKCKIANLRMSPDTWFECAWSGSKETAARHVLENTAIAFLKALRVKLIPPGTADEHRPMITVAETWRALRDMGIYKSQTIPPDDFLRSRRRKKPRAEGTGQSTTAASSAPKRRRATSKAKSDVDVDDIDAGADSSDDDDDDAEKAVGDEYDERVTGGDADSGARDAGFEELEIAKDVEAAMAAEAADE